MKGFRNSLSQRIPSRAASYVQFSDHLVADGGVVVDDVGARSHFELALSSRFLGEQLELLHELGRPGVEVLAKVVQDLRLVVVGAFPPSFKVKAVEKRPLRCLSSELVARLRVEGRDSSFHSVSHVLSAGVGHQAVRLFLVGQVDRSGGLSVRSGLLAADVELIGLFVLESLTCWQSGLWIGRTEVLELLEELVNAGALQLLAQHVLVPFGLQEVLQALESEKKVKTLEPRQLLVKCHTPTSSPSVL